MASFRFLLRAEFLLAYAFNPAQVGPFAGSVAVMTSSDDPDQLHANNYVALGIDKATLLEVVPVGGLSALIVDDLSWRFPLIFQLPGIPVAANTNVNVYIPTPQIISGIPFVFEGWADGPTANPRVFSIGQPGPSGYFIHPLMPAVLAPWINADSPLVNGASYQGGAVAPGEIVTLFGYNLGPTKLQTAQLDSAGRVATSLSGIQVSFNGTPAPIVYASATQTAVIVPYEVAGPNPVTMSIRSGTAASTPIGIPVTDSAPALFTSNSAGTGPLAAFNQDNSVNSVANPASPGDTIVMFGTGEGQTNSPLDGVIAGSSPPQPMLPVSATIGGLVAKVVYAGGVPGQTAGLLQLNVVVPAAAPSGLLPVILTVGTNSSQWGATIAIR